MESHENRKERKSVVLFYLSSSSEVYTSIVYTSIHYPALFVKALSYLFFCVLQRHAGGF
jgi:hypothetical protein